MGQNHKSEKQAIIQFFNGNYLLFYEHYFPDLRKVGKEHKAVCPFHDDTDPSLSVKQSTGLWHCHGCKKGGDIFTLYAMKHGLSLNGDFPKVCQSIANEFNIPVESKQKSTTKKKPNSKKGKIVQTYDYREDAFNELLFQKVRTEPKGFYIRRQGINGEWKNGLGKIKPVLYRLPELIDAPEVNITEGEKDADNLTKLGFTATTNFDGAGKWRDEYNHPLAGKNINIFPDNDEQGRKHAQLVASKLHGVAESVKIIELDGLEEKQDVSDYIKKFSDPEAAAESISSIIDNTPLYEPPEFEKFRSEFEFFHVSEIICNLRPIQWRIQDIIEDGTIGQHYGDSGTFKTFVALDRYLHIATGFKYHGHSVEQGTCFYICGEGQQGIGRRILAWCVHYGINPKDLQLFVARTVTDLMDPEALDNVKRAIDKMASKYGDPVAVFYDTLARNFGAGDENRTQDMSRAINNLTTTFGNSMIQEVAQHKGHMNKDRARGSIALHAAVDHEYEYTRQSDGRVLVKCKKMKDAPEAPPMLFIPKEINLQIDNQPFTSYVLELESQGDNVKLTPDINHANVSGNMRQALKILQQLYAECEKNLAADGREGKTPHVTAEEWRKACLDKGAYSRSDVFHRGAESLFRRGYTVYDDNQVHVYPTEIYKKYNFRE